MVIFNSIRIGDYPFINIKIFVRLRKIFPVNFYFINFWLLLVPTIITITASIIISSIIIIIRRFGHIISIFFIIIIYGVNKFIIFSIKRFSTNHMVFDNFFYTFSKIFRKFRIYHINIKSTLTI